MIDAKPLATLGPSEIDPPPGPVEVWGVWIPRKGDNLILPIDVVFNHGVNFRVELYHKNYGDPGDGASASASATFSQITGRQNLTQLSCKELVRVKLTLDRGSALVGNDVGIVFYRFLQPLWFESVKV